MLSFFCRVQIECMRECRGENFLRGCEVPSRQPTFARTSSSLPPSFPPSYCVCQCFECVCVHAPVLLSKYNSPSLKLFPPLITSLETHAHPHTQKGVWTLARTHARTQSWRDEQMRSQACSRSHALTWEQGGSHRDHVA